MKNKLNVSLECYTINLILDSNRQFKWLENQKLPILEIGNDIDFLIINIKKLKLSLEIEQKANLIMEQHKLLFPFTHNDFITFAETLASQLANVSNWLKNIKYMKEYILVPLLVSSTKICVGIIILNNFGLVHDEILESTTYLSSINNKKQYNTKEIEWKCNLLSGILNMKINNLSRQMKLYIMNCKNYIPQILIYRMPKKIKVNNLFQKLQLTCK